MYNNIDTECKALGMGHTTFVRVLGVKEYVLDDWIDGELKIPSCHGDKISLILRCSMDYLLSKNNEHERWKRYRMVKSWGLR